MNEDLIFRETEPPVLQYRAWTLIDRKSTTFLIVSMIAAFTYATFLLTGKTHLSVAVCILLLSSVLRLFVPIHFEWSTEGITRWVFGYRRTIPWSEIRSYTIQKEGILILPFQTRFPLDAFRGTFIPIPSTQKASVQRRLHFFLNKDSVKKESDSESDGK